MQPMNSTKARIAVAFAKSNLQAYQKELDRQKEHLKLYSREDYIERFGDYDLEKCLENIRYCQFEIRRAEGTIERYTSDY